MYMVLIGLNIWIATFQKTEGDEQEAAEAREQERQHLLHLVDKFWSEKVENFCSKKCRKFRAKNYFFELCVQLNITIFSKRIWINKVCCYENFIDWSLNKHCF